VTRIDPKRVAARYLAQKQGRTKTAGEVIFKKDRGGDASSWAYHDIGPSERNITDDFNYSPKNLKPLADVLRSSLAALGHVLSAYNTFAKVKSAKVSPDGNLGGKGYIQKIADMRKQYMNIVEALSAITDTLYDETNAPHWALLSRQESPEERQEVRELIQDSEKIRENPEEWADKEIAEEFDAPKKASLASKVARGYLAKHEDQIPGGLADKKQPKDFSKEQLAKGIKVEREHTKDPAKAREISMDHLTEDPLYYDKLETIEGDH